MQNLRHPNEVPRPVRMRHRRESSSAVRRGGGLGPLGNQSPRPQRAPQSFSHRTTSPKKRTSYKIGEENSNFSKLQTAKLSFSLQQTSSCKLYRKRRFLVQLLFQLHTLLQITIEILMRKTSVLCGYGIKICEYLTVNRVDQCR